MVGRLLGRRMEQLSMRGRGPREGMTLWWGRWPRRKVVCREKERKDREKKNEINEFLCLVSIIYSVSSFS